MKLVSMKNINQYLDNKEMFKFSKFVPVKSSESVDETDSQELISLESSEAS
jgi:hypothetical protein